ncbi:PGR5-like protein 1B, chloroplastic isoform X2 [Rhododendron vialii]|uniref:PGR5-like protein 1B, chloroplastic isoform X2 n=1 Tax=Rhododendron vialii TaxID=182163 RepID=UPI0026601894|nr:PGR5-like protein 1B, chloroplastic isoform X2 [Rhododendron vialii]
MATGASTSATTHVIGSAVIELARSNRTGAPFSVRISTKSNNGVFTRDERDPRAEGPSCIFVGPIETARKETLEALYRQARDAYYSGNPLIVDDMFDRVELKLRSYGSKYVVKYPRCSLRRQSTYADAEEDPSQVFLLAGVWLLFLGFGSSACLIPVIYSIGHAYQDAFSSGYYYSSQPSQFLAILNGMLFMALGSVIGYPIASASVKALEGLWRNDLVAVKGACPNCGEEVFGFARSNQSNYSPHRADCHVCECSLEFRTKVEQSISIPGRRLVYGRIYLIKQRGRSHHQRWK